VDAPGHNSFPPAPPNARCVERLSKIFANATKPSNLKKPGCAVCWCTHLRNELSDLSSLNIRSECVNTAGFSLLKKERRYSTEPIAELDGPTIDYFMSLYICSSCKDKVEHIKKMPKFALARGLMAGEIPDELQQLSFAGEIINWQVRHNRFVVRVAKGHA